MKKLFCLISVLCLTVIVSSCLSKVNLTDQVCYNNYCFDVEIADTEEARHVGLQKRESLEDHEGMLFIFPDRLKHRFWMKDTLIPLDIIWIDYDRKVVDIKPYVEPCQEDPCEVYTPEYPAQYVLEVRAGMAKEIKMYIGCEVDLRLRQNKNR